MNMNMNMNNKQVTRFWTFDTLVAAFLDLFIAYFLLCASTIALFAVNFLGLFGLSLPNPSNGLLGIHSSDYRSLLVDYPTDKISAVQFSVTRKSPFDSMFFGVHNRDSNKDLNLNNGDGFMELEVEASCSSNSKSVARKLVGNENDDSGVMIENKRGLSYRFRGGSRRRRKASSFDNSSVSSSSNWVTCVNDEEHGGVPECSSILSDVSNYNYETETPMVVKSVSEATDAQKRIPVNEADKDKMIDLLKRELDESQAARAALYVELEKERNAAASAADEAMSMILRLQEEKASTKMEFGQYRRMIEEKSAFDAEEMNILKEIVLRREREKHFLERQVEAYRQMIRFENNQINGGNDQDFISRLYEDFDCSKQEKVEKTIAVVGEEKDLEIKPGDASCSYDVHVINNELNSSENTNKNKRKTDENNSGSETSVGLPSESSKSSLRRYSTTALDNERTRLDTEVEWLRERLRIVQEGRGKLIFSLENQEKESLQLELLEDIVRQLQEIRMLTEPQTARRASLPLPSSKVGLRKIRLRRSVSSSTLVRSS